MIPKFVLCVLISLFAAHSESAEDGWEISYPCVENKKISYHTETAESDDGEYQFFLYIDEKLKKDTLINITLLTPAIVNTADASMELYISRYDSLNMRLLRDEPKISIRLKTYKGIIPDVEKVLINNIEKCKPGTTNDAIVFNNLSDRLGETKKPVTLSRVPAQECGVRKVEHTQLITHALETKPGDWPWHVALYRLQDSSIQYICGGTLISTNIVLTAAHCVTEGGIQVIPQTLRVVLGKYNLFGGDETPQDKKVFEIRVHKDFKYGTLDNDIALIRLKTEASYNDYVQPSCVWTPELADHFPSSVIMGTVVGWGIDQTHKISSELGRATMPIIPDLNCIRSNPIFFANHLTDHNFCAGLRNGTSACNGDSGGGFHVFVPDTPGDTSPNAPGRWHVRGITSLAVSLKDIAACDPDHYVLFTDIGKFKGWINEFL